MRQVVCVRQTRTHRWTPSAKVVDKCTTMQCARARARDQAIEHLYLWLISSSSLSVTSNNLYPETPFAIRHSIAVVGRPIDWRYSVSDSASHLLGS